nr:hypothetical protein [Tanacetum cinerariifolium]
GGKKKKNNTDVPLESVVGSGFLLLVDDTSIVHIQKEEECEFSHLFTPTGNGIDVVIVVEFIRAIRERFANATYCFFLGKRVAYPVVAKYVRNTWGKYGLVKSMLNSSIRLFTFQFSSMDGLEAMLENEDVGNVPVWVKLHGVPVRVFTDDGLSVIATKLCTPLMLDSYTSDMCMQSLGLSSYARAMIELRADVELKDTIMVEEYPKNISSDEAKNLKKSSQVPRGVLVGPKLGLKPAKQVYRHVSKKPSANTSKNKKKDVKPTKEASERVGFGTNSMLEQWSDTYENFDYDYDDPYDDDMYEGQDIPKKIQSICDNLDIKVRENVIIEGADNRPPMLDKTQYIWNSYTIGTTTTPTIIRHRRYDELTEDEKIRESCDIKATNIFLQDPGEPIHLYYMLFVQLMNDMHIIGMTMKPIQFNTKFINHLQPEWSKFVTDVKLAKDTYNANFDHLFAYLRQHEAHANEARQAKIDHCYNCQEEGHMVRQCTKLKRPRNSVWFKEKSKYHKKFQTPTTFQTDNLDAFDFDCDEAPSTRVVLMAKLSFYDSEVLKVSTILDDDSAELVSRRANGLVNVSLSNIKTSSFVSTFIEFSGEFVALMFGEVLRVGASLSIEVKKEDASVYLVESFFVGRLADVDSAWLSTSPEIMCSEVKA